MRQPRTAVLGLASAAAVALAVYLLRLNQVAGQVVDDAWYVMLAKAMAAGQGYRLVNAPEGFVLPMYPPGFPAVLSLAFRLDPDFPANVWLLKSISIAAMAAAGGLAFVYLQRYRGVPPFISACVAAAFVLMPAFVFLATSTVMSECVFTLVQLTAVVLLHRASPLRGNGQSLAYASAAGVAVGAAVLIRSAGWMALAAGLLWLLVSERRRREAIGFTLAAVVILLPWLWYARVHATPERARLAHGGSIIYSYSEQFWMRWAGAPSSGEATIGDLPARIATNAIDIFGRATAGQVMPMIFRGPSESGEEVVALGGAAGISAASMGNAAAAQAIGFAISAVMLIGYVNAVRQKPSVAEYLVPLSLALTLVWPFWSFRFVLPLAPYLLLYFVAGLHWINARFAPSNDRWQIARMAIACVLGLHVIDHVGYVLHTRDASTRHPDQWVATAEDADATLSWMARHLEPGVVASTNPALVHLRTGAPTITFDRMSDSWDVWRDRGARYVAALRPLDLPPASLGRYTLRYRSPLGAWVIELD